MTDEPLTPELLVRAYCCGAFPMADSRHGAIGWYRPDRRGVLPMDADGLHIPRSLAKFARRGLYTITTDQAFADVITRCAEPAPGREDTWINDEIIANYCHLFDMGLAHSVEAWVISPTASQQGNDKVTRQSPQLVGGIYGVSLGAAFFGESMFSHADNASKLCLVELFRHLHRLSYRLFDIQMVTPVLEQFGAIEITGQQYLAQLHDALACKPNGRWANAWRHTITADR